MKVVVTGGSGKAGQWVARHFAEQGHGVLVFDRAAGPKVEGVRYLIGDIEDLGQVYGALNGHDAVIHLAGIPSHSIVSNEATFRINTVGTFNVHEAAFTLGIKRVVTISSEAVLGWAPGSYQRFISPDYLPVDELHPCRPQDAYGLSKVCCEQIGASYVSKSDMTCVFLRPPWIVSPEELLSLRQKGGIQPSGFRLYHYIDARDMAEACRQAVEQPLSGFNVFFVGSGESSVGEPLSQLYARLVPELAEKARAIIGSDAPVSIGKARTMLKWSPRYSWRQGPG
jgi:nucleoside-diphosphate-sugar epimerase